MLTKTRNLIFNTKLKFYNKQFFFISKKNFLNKKQEDNFCFDKNSIINDNLTDTDQKNSISQKDENKVLNSPIKTENTSNNTMNITLDNEIEVDNKLKTPLSTVVNTEMKNFYKLLKTKGFYKDVLQLTKFKLCVLNAMVSVSTYAFYSTQAHLFMDFIFFTGGTMCISMTTQVLNQVSEKFPDKKMKRTAMRPLPKQRMTTFSAGIIGSALWISSTIFYLQTCPNAIIFSNLILLLYIKGYTPMKKNSNLCMHIGALVGALPALLGSFAATNEIFLESSVLLAAYIFAWQYPHFYGILYQNKDDYKKAGFNFISNYEEKNYIAYYQMIVAMIAMIFIVYKLHSGKDKIINSLTFATFLGFHAYNFISVYKFKNAPVKYAKQIRKRSYMGFLIVLFSFMYSAYDMRSKTVNANLLETNKNIKILH